MTAPKHRVFDARRSGKPFWSVAWLTTGEPYLVWNGPIHIVFSSTGYQIQGVDRIGATRP